ncbi:hypothetical protein HOY80DRAFT_1065903 [Tuber brumale]|nr:hypothetical protein HOY80DRAFT_1065903 [Tuber brumale]
MKAHPEAKKFHKRSLVNYDILYELCTNISATGEHALTSNLSSQTESQFPPTEQAHSQTSRLPATPLAKSNSPYTQVALGTSIVSRDRSGKRYLLQEKREESGGSGMKDGEGREVTVDESTGLGGSGRRKRERRNALAPESGREEEEEEKIPVSKKSRPERKTRTTGHAIAQALDHLSATAQTIQPSKVELAVERLQEDYESIFTINQFVKALVVMENDVKASIFIALKAGEARDLWIQEAINKL